MAENSHFSFGSDTWVDGIYFKLRASSFRIESKAWITNSTLQWRGKGPAGCSWCLEGQRAGVDVVGQLYMSSAFSVWSWPSIHAGPCFTEKHCVSSSRTCSTEIDSLVPPAIVCHRSYLQWTDTTCTAEPMACTGCCSEHVIWCNTTGTSFLLCAHNILFWHV